MHEVRRLRREKGWNQNELAFYADLAPSVISLIETGKREPNATTLRKLAEALDVEIPDLFEKADSPKAQAPQPLENKDAWRRGWQSLAEVRVELLEQSASMWENQIDRGQYDLQTIKEMDQAAFSLALNHILEEGEIKQWCTQEQREKLELAEKRTNEVYEKIWRAFEAEFEKEKPRLTPDDVVSLERYREEKQARSAEASLRHAATGT